MRKEQLDTPALVLDLEVLDVNLRKMRDMAAAAGKKLRPHIKTHKCSRLAKRQLECGNCAGFCTAKLAEAEALFAAGVENILITSPVALPQKIERLAALAAQNPEIMVVVDNYSNAQALNSAMGKFKTRLQILVDIDPDMGRTGVSFEHAVELVRSIHTLPHLRFQGIQCYAGHLQHVIDYHERRRQTLGHMQQAAAIVRTLRQAKIDCPVFTGTGTGTSDIDITIPELTDIQVGSYCVMDAEYAAIHTYNQPYNEAFRPALTLLTSVVSRNQKDFVTIDAGLKSLYFTPHAPPRVIRHHQIQPDFRYDWFGDEHGRLEFSGEKPELGALIELVLPHCDPTINLHDKIHVVENGEVVDTWPIDLRGLSH